MKKLNTAIICLSPNSGGMEIDTIKLAKKLYPHTSITVIAKQDGYIANTFRDHLSAPQATVETVQFRHSLSLSIIVNVRKIIKKHNIVNVIFFGASELKSLYFAFLGLEINLIVRHGTTKSNPKKDWFHRLIYSKVNYHVSICQHLQNNVNFIVPFGKNAKSVLIYLSVDIKAKQVDSPRLPTLLHVGRIARGKGQADALLACDILYKNNIDFIFYIIGGFEDGYKKEFTSLLNSLPYKNNIQLIGFTKNIDEYLEKSNIFLFPSHGEGLGNAFLEALSAGLSCICFNNTSFPELLSLGFNFQMVENKNLPALKEALMNLISNNVFHNKNQHNHELAKKLFSPQREISQYLELLR
ncbi:glycosyltransferase family 4 protein [Sulfurospirillum tamanense]|nr:glycosyltransferase family 4 protein [Sulfurospirillum tamanensis]